MVNTDWDELGIAPPVTVNRFPLWTDLDLPAYCMISAEDRTAEWRKRPPRPYPSFKTAKVADDPGTIALRRELEEAAERKKQEGLRRLAEWKAANG